MSKSWADIPVEEKNARRKELVDEALEIIESSPEEFIEAREDEDDLEEIIDSLFVNHIVMGVEDFMDQNEIEDDSEGYELFKEWFEEDITKEIMKLEE